MLTLSQLYQILRDYFNSPSWQAYLMPLLAFFCLVFSLFLLFLAIVLAIKSDVFWKIKLMLETSRSFSFSDEFEKKWQRIMKRLSQGDENNLKIAVVETDKLFSDFLLTLGYRGKQTEERFGQITEAQLSNLMEVWQAHKVRDMVARDKDYKLTRGEAEKTIAAFENAFKEWMML